MKNTIKRIQDLAYVKSRKQRYLPESHQAPEDREKYLLQSIIVCDKLNRPSISSIVVVVRTIQACVSHFPVLCPSQPCPIPNQKTVASVIYGCLTRQDFHATTPCFLTLHFETLGCPLYPQQVPTCPCCLFVQKQEAWLSSSLISQRN